MEKVSDMSEAERIKGIAESMYKRGIMLEATFSKGASKLVKWYICPSDIPLFLYRNYTDRFFLFSVHKANP